MRITGLTALRLLAALLLGGVLAGCETRPDGAPAETTAAQAEEEKQAVPTPPQLLPLFEQEQIDPLQNYLQNQAEQAENGALAPLVEAERARRCQRIAKLYAAREKNAANLRRLRLNYAYACPEIIQAFTAQAERGEPIPAKRSSLDPRACRRALQSGDYPLAASVCRQLAHDGVADAQNILATWYLQGAPELAIQADKAQALRWFKAAAELGHAQAQFNLGTLYINEQYGMADAEKAARWFFRAARQGVPEAQLNLGMMFAMGQGVEENYLEALVWLTLAAEEGRREALIRRDLVLDKLSPAQIADARARATALGRAYRGEEK